MVEPTYSQEPKGIAHSFKTTNSNNSKRSREVKEILEKNVEAVNNPDNSYGP